MKDKVPPPQMTPAPYQPDREAEPTTGDAEAIATHGFVTRHIASADVKWFVASMAATAIAAVLLVGWFDARAQEKDAGVERRASEALEEHKKSEALAIAELKVTVERNRQEAAQAARDQGQKLDAIMFRFGVPNPAPTPVAPVSSRDGGN